MRDIHNILIATDLTERSSAAIRLAMKLAGRSSASVTLFHAYHVPSPGSNVMIEISDVVHNKAVTQMEGLAHILKRNHPKVKLSFKVVTGQAAVMIRKEIREVNADLLVLGSVAKVGGVSVPGTAALVLDTGVPTLIVPSEVDFTAEEMSRVSIAIDSVDEHSEHQVQEALSWCELLHIKEVHFLHVKTKEEKRGLELERYIALLKSASRMEMRLVIMPEGNPEASIRSYLETEKIHLLFVFHDVKNKINPLADISVTRALIEGADNPVFVIQ